MSKQKKGFGRAGLSGLATTTLVIGACAAFIAPANAAAGAFTADSTPNLTVGQSGQTAGDLHYEFSGTFATNSKIVIDIADSDGNNCAAAGDQGISFAAVPTITVSPVGATTGTTPTATATLQSSDANCTTVGVKDELVVTLNGGQPSTTTGEFNLNLTGVQVNVGANAHTGADVVTAAENGGTASTTSNGTVVNRSFTFIPRKSAEPGTTGNALGTATFTEAANNAYFGTAGHVTEVDLKLSAGTFTAGITPTISVPSGYTVESEVTPATSPRTFTAGTPKTDGTDTYTFYVKAPATASKGTITVAGLEANAPSSVQVVTIQPTLTQDVDTATPGSADTLAAVKALNVVAQDRVGGSDRYATAAAIFNKEFGNNCANNFNPFGSTGFKLVVSGGELFPDALSANYLASKLGNSGPNTGTLLTRANSLPDVTKNAILNSGADTVYITGQETAVSQKVADEIASLKVCNGGALANNINVVRIGGKDRYATNAAINRNNATPAANHTAILAAGTAPYDSLSAGPVVYADQYPLVLTDGSTLGHDEEGQFQDLGVKNVVIVGGESVVSKPVADQLTKDGYNVIRLAGATRFDTAATIATWATTGIDNNADGDFTNDGLYSQAADTLASSVTDIANGLAFPDALADGPAAGNEGHPLLLAQSATTPGDALTGYLGGKSVGTANDDNHVGTLLALGLNAATSNSMIDDAAASIEK